MNNFDKFNSQFYYYETQGCAPNAPVYQKERAFGFGLVSMVVGIISLLFCTRLNILTIPYFPIVLGLTAIVLSIISFRKRPKAFGMIMAIAGLVLGLITFAKVIILWDQVRSML